MGKVKFSVFTMTEHSAFHCCDNTLRWKDSWEEERVYCSLFLQVRVRHWGKSGHELQPHRILLAASPPTYSLCSQLVFLHRSKTRPTCLGMASPTVDWTLPYQSLIQAISHRHGHSSVWLGNTSVKVPSFQITLGCTKMIIKTNQDRGKQIL